MNNFRVSELETIKGERAALRDAYLKEFSSLGASNSGLFPAMVQTQCPLSGSASAEDVAATTAPATTAASDNSFRQESMWSEWCRSISQASQTSNPGERFLTHMSRARPVSHAEWLKECRVVQPVHIFLRRGQGRGGGGGSGGSGGSIGSIGSSGGSVTSATNLADEQSMLELERRESHLQLPAASVVGGHAHAIAKSPREQSPRGKSPRAKSPQTGRHDKSG